MPRGSEPVEILGRLIPPGSRVLLGTAAGAAVSLQRTLATLSHQIDDLHLIGGMQLGDYDFMDPVRAGRWTYDTWHVMPAIRRDVEESCVGLYLVRGSRVPELIRTLRPDVFITSVSPPNANGEVSFGASVSYARAIVDLVPTVIAEVHEDMPFSTGETSYPAERFDALVEVPDVIPEYAARAPQPEDHAIAAHVADLIPDGATVQIGIGGVPESLVSLWRRDPPENMTLFGMGIEAIVPLVDEGAGRIRFIGGELLGTKLLYRFADRNPLVQMFPIDRILRVPAVASIPHFISVNSAIEVDLTGQVNAEWVNGRQVSGPGGSFDFVDSALFSDGGLSIIALRSTALSGSASTIVPSLTRNAPVTVPRHSVQVVVTEHGVADLRDRTLQQRREALAAIAAPQFRDKLADSALAATKSSDDEAPRGRVRRGSATMNALDRVDRDVGTAWGWSDDEWPRLTIGDAFDRAIDLHGPDKLAFTYVNEALTLTLGQLRSSARRWAKALLRSGVSPGDRVAIMLPGHSQWPALQLACAYVGAVMVGVNTRYRLNELRQVFGVARPTVVITVEEWRGIPFADLVQAAYVELSAESRTPLPRFVTLGTVGRGAFVASSTLLAHAAADDDDVVVEASAAVSPDDGAIVQFTSGSTADPKGVLVSHDAMLRTAFHLGKAAGYCGDDTVFSALPFYHIGGSICTGLGGPVTGAHMVVPSTFSPGESLETLRELSCTAQQGHAAMFTMQIDHAQATGVSLPQVPKGWVAAPPSVIARIFLAFEAEHLISVYGMSEYGLISACTADDSRRQRTETVGRPIPGTQVRVSGKGRVGEAQVRGPLAMLGYLGDEEATRRAFTDDGWLRTGDLVSKDSDFLIFEGREKDMIKPGGENVSARELEEFLMSHPAVSQAAVFGVPDQRLGEVPAAVVQPVAHGGLAVDELLSYCQGRIAQFKTPRRIYVVQEMPLLPNGKIDKRTLASAFSGDTEA